jgi:hypothetical protein
LPYFWDRTNCLLRIKLHMLDNLRICEVLLTKLGLKFCNIWQCKQKPLQQTSAHHSHWIYYQGTRSEELAHFHMWCEGSFEACEMHHMMEPQEHGTVWAAIKWFWIGCSTNEVGEDCQQCQGA